VVADDLALVVVEDAAVAHPAAAKRDRDDVAGGGDAVLTRGHGPTITTGTDGHRDRETLTRAAY
jgi:hypothetical protein